MERFFFGVELEALKIMAVKFFKGWQNLFTLFLLKSSQSKK